MANYISTFKTYLMYKEKDSDSWDKLYDISQFPDLGQDPNTIDVTTLSNSQKVFIQGIKSSDNLVFNGYYDKTDFAKVDALKNKTGLHFAVWFGASESSGVYTPDGNQGKFETKGQVSIRVTGGGVDEAVGVAITVTPSEEIKLVTASGT